MNSIIYISYNLYDRYNKNTFIMKKSLKLNGVYPDRIKYYIKIIES